MSKPVSRVKPFLCGALTDGDVAQHAVVGVHHTPPGQGFGIDVQAREAGAFFLGQVVGIGLVDAQFLQSLEHRQGEFAAAVFGGRAQAIEEASSLWRDFVEHARVNGRGQQVVGCRDGVNIAGQVQVEIFHGNNLAVAAASCAALDAKGRALRGLADAGEDVLAQVSAQRLTQANHGGAFAFAQRGRGDGSHVDVFAIGYILEPLEDLQADLGFVVSVEF